MILKLWTFSLTHFLVLSYNFTHFKILSKKSALDVADLIEQKYDAFKKSSFFPDFGHPNRQVHKLIFEKIKPYV